MTAPDRFVPIEEAGRRYAVPYRTLRKRVIDGTIPTYRSDRDRRLTLVAVDDMARLFEPRSVTNNQEGGPLTTA